MVRLSQQNPLQKAVHNWRQKHPDWKDLAQYIAQVIFVGLVAESHNYYVRTL